MLIVPHVVKTIEVDYPPGSKEIVGIVEVSKLTTAPEYAGVAGYLGDLLVYQKQVIDRIISIRPHEARIERAAERAALIVRYNASLAYNLPGPIDLVT